MLLNLTKFTLYKWLFLRSRRQRRQWRNTTLSSSGPPATPAGTSFREEKFNRILAPIISTTLIVSCHKLTFKAKSLLNVIVQHLARALRKDNDETSTWAVSGRSEAKLRKVLDEASKVAQEFFNAIHIFPIDILKKSWHARTKMPSHGLSNINHPHPFTTPRSPG